MGNRVLLVRPPTIMKGASFIACQFPLNIASIAAVLMENGYEVKIWDFDVKPLDEIRFEKEIRDFDPVVVGISAYTPTIINGHKIARMVKKAVAGVSTVIGGPHVSAMPIETLNEFGDFDVGVIGEGEKTMLELADCVTSGGSFANVNGLVYRENGSVEMTRAREPIKDLDKLPLPSRGLLDIGLYKGQSHRGFSRGFLKITEMMTSRGCPNRCIFCASGVVMGGGVRFRSAASVKEEIGRCVDLYGFNHFTISDDTFTLAEARLYEICDEFARRRVTWNCNARVWPLSQKMLLYMKKCGCIGITFGVESGSPRILKLIKKNVTVEQIEDAFRWSRDAGIKLIEADVILGSHPSESIEDVRMTRRLLGRISPDIAMVSIVVPYPGTEVYDMMKDKALIIDNSAWNSFVLFGKDPSWRTENFTSEDLVRLQKSIMLGFYFRLPYMLRIFGKFKNAGEAVYWMRGGMEFLLTCLRPSTRTVKSGWKT